VGETGKNIARSRHGSGFGSRSCEYEGSEANEVEESGLGELHLDLKNVDRLEVDV
jgi:hypothetical protein